MFQGTVIAYSTGILYSIAYSRFIPVQFKSVLVQRAEGKLKARIFVSRGTSAHIWQS